MEAREAGDPEIESIELVRRAQAGEGEAFAALIERYYGRVLAVVRRRLGPELRRELESGDVVQEAMVEVIRTFDRFDMRDERALVRWLAGLVENRIRDFAKFYGAERRERRREVAPPREADSGERGGGPLLPPDQGRSPLEEVARREQRERMQAALATLNPRYRAVIEARREGARWSEVARRLELSSDGAARILHSLALVTLMKALAAEAGPPDGEPPPP